MKYKCRKLIAPNERMYEDWEVVGKRIIEAEVNYDVTNEELPSDVLDIMWKMNIEMEASYHNERITVCLEESP